MTTAFPPDSKAVPAVTSFETAALWDLVVVFTDPVMPAKALNIEKAANCLSAHLMEHRASRGIILAGDPDQFASLGLAAFNIRLEESAQEVNVR